MKSSMYCVSLTVSPLECDGMVHKWFWSSETTPHREQNEWEVWIEWLGWVLVTLSTSLFFFLSLSFIRVFILALLLLIHSIYCSLSIHFPICIFISYIQTWIHTNTHIYIHIHTRKNKTYQTKLFKSLY